MTPLCTAGKSDGARPASNNADLPARVAGNPSTGDGVTPDIAHPPAGSVLTGGALRVEVVVIYQNRHP
jgi:hypothetical protein